MDRSRITKKQRVAHHEAGHAVVSAAINDAPVLVSIRGNDTSLGRSRYRFEAGPERLIQVHLAGFAAEEVLSGRHSRQLRGLELGVSIAAVTRSSHAALACVEGSDQHLAVQEILKMGCDPKSASIRAEFERFYAIAKASVEAVWPAVVSVAEALLKQSDLESRAFFEALRGHDIYGPVFAIQKAYGLRA
jgi:hypothetical protein